MTATTTGGDARDSAARTTSVLPHPAVPDTNSTRDEAGAAADAAAVRTKSATRRM